MKRLCLSVFLILTMVFALEVSAGISYTLPEKWYDTHRHYTGDHDLTVGFIEDGVIGIRIDGEEYTYIDIYDSLDAEGGGRFFSDFDGMTNVIVKEGDDGKLTIRLTNGKYAGTYTEKESDAKFEKSWFEDHIEYIYPGSAHILDVYAMDDQFTLSRDNVFVASFPKFEYTLSSDGKSAIFQSRSPEGVLATVTAGDYYKIYVSGTDHDGEYLEIVYVQ